MQNQKTDVNFTPLPSRNPDEVRMLRLTSDRGQPQLLLLSEGPKGDNLLSVVHFESGATSIYAPPLKSSLGLPAWDVFVAGANGPVLVWTQPGSASCPLRYRAADGTEVVLTGKYPDGVFTNPRFVRGDPKVAMTTAIAYEDSGRAAVLFSEAIESGNADYKLLPPSSAGLVEQPLLISSGADYFLLLKVRSGPATPERTDGSGSTIQPGQLYMLRLTASMEASGRPVKPFGETPVYEFDADIAGSTAVLFASTTAGASLMTAGKSGNNLVWATPTEISSPIPLASPVVTLAGSETVAAAIAAMGTIEARVIVARTSIPAAHRLP